jgi:hypothetical protein
LTDRDDPFERILSVVSATQEQLATVVVSLAELRDSLRELRADVREIATDIRQLRRDTSDLASAFNEHLRWHLERS